MNPNNQFNMHEINRLIMREQIPGFKMLPKEVEYLAQYRKALMEYHQYSEREKNEEAVRDAADRMAKIEARKEAIRAKKANRKNANRSEQSEPQEVVEPTVEETPVVEETPEQTEE